MGCVTAGDGRVGRIVVELVRLLLGHGVESRVGLCVEVEDNGVGLPAHGTHGCGVVFQRADMLPVLIVALGQRCDKDGNGSGGTGVAYVRTHVVGEGGGGNVLEQRTFAGAVVRAELDEDVVGVDGEGAVPEALLGA